MINVTDSFAVHGTQHKPYPSGISCGCHFGCPVAAPHDKRKPRYTPLLRAILSSFCPFLVFLDSESFSQNTYTPHRAGATQYAALPWGLPQISLSRCLPQQPKPAAMDRKKQRCLSLIATLTPRSQDLRSHFCSLNSNTLPSPALLSGHSG